MSSPAPLPRRRRVLYAGFVLAAAIATWLIFGRHVTFRLPDAIRLPGDDKIHMRRPYGMTPAAFNAFIRACYRAGVSPNRTTQTIGDNPRSFGYHHRDGVLQWNGERIEYSAATDIHVMGLSAPQIQRLVKALGVQGFACWYRHEGKWKGIEHIHAVYAFLPMKRQLKRQVRLYLREENPPWEKKWKRSRYAGD